MVVIPWRGLPPAIKVHSQAVITRDVEGEVFTTAGWKWRWLSWTTGLASVSSVRVGAVTDVSTIKAAANLSSILTPFTWRGTTNSFLAALSGVAHVTVTLSICSHAAVLATVIHAFPSIF